MGSLRDLFNGIQSLPHLVAIPNNQLSPAERRVLAYVRAMNGMAPSYEVFEPPPERFVLTAARVAKPEEVTILDLFDPVTGGAYPIKRDDDVEGIVRRALEARQQPYVEPKRFDPAAPLNMFDPTDMYVTAVAALNARKNESKLETLTRDTLYFINPRNL